MSSYYPPLDDMKFVLDRVVGLNRLPEHPDLGKLDIDMVESVLEPAAKLASEVLAPLNKVGDEQGCELKDGSVKTPDGFPDAYAQYRDGGWNAVPFHGEYGGQDLPWLVAFPLQEMWQGANMSFGLCPLLNQGAVEAIENHGSTEQKEYYLPKLISGEWTGTMNLTEPQAGSDLSVIRTKADPQGDGSYKISGQKIYITYGEHDFADNIIHLVLARLPDAPEGVKGISLFIVPKFLADGSRNDLTCTGLEHKLGIHASPTCTMQFGDKGGATGYLVGQANEGLKYMFTMMNNARLSVGLQGVAIAERAFQHALAYAHEREQGTSLTDKGLRVSIVTHGDVKRMLLSMHAQIEAMRALTYDAALQLDLAEQGDAEARAKADLLTPVVKAFCTDMAVEVTSTGVQIHGGMGFIEETGAAQYYRDARILPIYEGTNGIQAIDLMFRKTMRDSGAALKAYLAEAQEVVQNLEACDEAGYFAKNLADAIEKFAASSKDVLQKGAEDPDYAACVAVPYLRAFGILAGGVMMARSFIAADEAMKAGQGDADFFQRKKNTVHFYAAHILPKAQAYLETVAHGAETVMKAKF
jgi:alkylation response protein AidB-like acyl-CoA dehydrogenase